MRRTFLTLCVVGFLTALAGTPASAATLRIEFDDFNVAFDGYALTDNDSVDGQVDALKTMDFFLDNVFVGTLTSDIFANMYIGVDDPIPATGGAVEGAPYSYFALYTNSQLNEGVGLSLDKVDLFFNPTGNTLGLAGFASASLLGQVLPFNLAFTDNEPIERDLQRHSGRHLQERWRDHELHRRGHGSGAGRGQRRAGADVDDSARHGAARRGRRAPPQQPQRAGRVGRW